MSETSFIETEYNCLLVEKFKESKKTGKNDYEAFEDVLEAGREYFLSSPRKKRFVNSKRAKPKYIGSVLISYFKPDYWEDSSAWRNPDTWGMRGCTIEPLSYYAITDDLDSIDRIKDFYIGETEALDRRLKAHISSAKRNGHENSTPLIRSIWNAGRKAYFFHLETLDVVTFPWKQNAMAIGHDGRAAASMEFIWRWVAYKNGIAEPREYDLKREIEDDIQALINEKKFPNKPYLVSENPEE